MLRVYGCVFFLFLFCLYIGVCVCLQIQGPLWECHLIRAGFCGLYYITARHTTLLQPNSTLVRRKTRKRTVCVFQRNFELTASFLKSFHNRLQCYNLTNTPRVHIHLISFQENLYTIHRRQVKCCGMQGCCVGGRTGVTCCLSMVQVAATTM